MSRPTFRWVADSETDLQVRSGVMTLLSPDARLSLKLPAFTMARDIQGAIERAYEAGAVDARAELAAQVRQVLGRSGA